MKFRSENLLENENKNRWNLTCGELLLSLIRTRSFGEKESSSSFLQSKVATLLWRKDDEDPFSPKLRVRIKDNNNSSHGKFHRFLFPFSSKFSDRNFVSYVLYIYLCYVTCHTHSEPGLPMGILGNFSWSSGHIAFPQSSHL